jgi:hypothetical protein
MLSISTLAFPSKVQVPHELEERRVEERRESLWLSSTQFNQFSNSSDFIYFNIFSNLNNEAFLR